MNLKGLGVSNGIGIGKAVVLEEYQFDTTKQKANSAEEENRFLEAVKKLKSILEEKAKNTSGEQAEILESHMDMLEDPVILSEIKDIISSESCNGEHAVSIVFEQYAKAFETSEDELLELRAADLRDIKNNLLAVLFDKPLMDVSNLPKGSILAAEELTTSIAAGINPEHIAAIVTQAGGKTSHMAIIARSIGIPAIVGIDIRQIENGTNIIVDGENGEIWLDPSEDQIEEYTKRQEQMKEKKIRLEQFRGMQSVTRDGISVEIFANIGLELDIEHAVAADAEGVGLFRTEFLYMNRNFAPREEEQFQIYKKAAKAFQGKPVIIRTLDIGGDKEIPYMELEKEENPFLGWRAIRYCLDRQEIFQTQIRAILRASVFGDIKIMIPMISTITEFRKAKRIICEEKEKLQKENIAVQEEISIGIMIETPAAAVMADVFAKEVDFFSIGTNDLTQYTMAVDRGNKKVANLYSTYHPAVMRFIYQVAQAAKENNILCGVCGEAAGDPLLVKFLVGSGIGELSMAGVTILQTREIIRNASYNELSEKIKKDIYKLQDLDEAVSFLKEL